VPGGDPQLRVNPCWGEPRETLPAERQSGAAQPNKAETGDWATQTTLGC